MQLFLDTADPKELAELSATGLIDGVTTNPSLIAKAGRPILETIKEICAITPGPVSAEAVADDVKGMLAEAAKLRALASNVVIKLPLTMEGLKACKALSDDGARVNVTLCFSAPQALLAAKAGAAFISPFVGRLDDGGQDGMELIEQIHTIYEKYDFETNILAASIRTVGHVRDAALAGADCATIPPSVFRAMYKHALTDAGLAAFMKDWNASGQKIL
ncbi:MAG: fructose-6-phosphate aldolase [Hyphomonadaceae bacterium]